MRGPEHMAFAVFTTGGALWLTSQGRLDLAATVAAMGTAAVGSLAPDIDHKQAWISARIPVSLIVFGGTFLLLRVYGAWMLERDGASGIGAVLGEPLLGYSASLAGWAWLALMVGVALLLTSWMVRRVAGHRGPTHSLAITAGATLAACAVFGLARLPVVLGLWFGWGYLSHLLADGLTPKRCPALLWPLGRESGTRVPAATVTAESPIDRLTPDPQEEGVAPSSGYQQY